MWERLVPVGISFNTTTIWFKRRYGFVVGGSVIAGMAMGFAQGGVGGRAGVTFAW
jgi:hypothetical protein